MCYCQGVCHFRSRYPADVGSAAARATPKPDTPGELVLLVVSNTLSVHEELCVIYILAYLCKPEIVRWRAFKPHAWLGTCVHTRDWTTMQERGGSCLTTHVHETWHLWRRQTQLAPVWVNTGAYGTPGWRSVRYSSGVFASHPACTSSVRGGAGQGGGKTRMDADAQQGDDTETPRHFWNTYWHF